MSDNMSRSVTCRIRFPNEFLAIVDEYAAAHSLPRSVAVRKLIGHGLASQEAKQPQQLAA